MVAPIGTSLSARSWKKGSIRRRVCVRWPVVVGLCFLIITTTKDIARDSGQQHQQQNSPFFLPFSHVHRRRDGWLSRKDRVSRSPSTAEHSANHCTNTRGDANNIFLKISKSPPKQFSKIFKYYKKILWLLLV
jgi:hypothetical protein